jgi:uncharacterized protein
MKLLAALLLLCLTALAQTSDKATKKYQAIFEMSAGEAPRLEAVIRNIDNLKIALGPENVEVAIVFHGPAILTLTKNKSTLAQTWERLAKSGVAVLGCANSLKMRDIPRDSLLPFVKVVDSAVAELVRKQHDGWAYLRNAN